MRRVSVLMVVGAVIAAFVALTGASGAVAARPVHRTAEFTLSAGNGLRVTVQAQDRGVVLVVTRRHQVAFYAVPGRVSQTGDVEARFGGLGRISVAFEPDSSIRHPCKEVPEGTDGVFVGTIRFRGERHYLSLDADRAKGNADVPAVPASCEPESRKSGPERPLLTSGFLTPNIQISSGGSEESEAGENETAYLTAQSRNRVSFVAIGRRQPGQDGESDFFGGKVEHRRRMLVFRGASVPTRTATAFDFDAQLESAALRPPKPFHGEATFHREPDGATTWRGSLSVTIFGGDRVALTGRDVVAKLVREIPFEE